MKRKKLALVLALVLATTFTGCGQETTSSSTTSGSIPESSEASASSGEVEESSTPADDKETVTVRLGGWGDYDNEHKPGTVGMEEALGIKVEYQRYPSDADFWNNLPAQIAANTAPDFIVLSNELYLPYIKDGLIAPIDEYLEDGTITCWDTIGDNLKEIWTVDGHTYGVPYFQIPEVFAINMNLWREAGLSDEDLPETWDDVLAACKVFKEKLNMPGLCFNIQEFHFTQYCQSFGGGWGLGKTIDSPENAEAIQFLIDAHKEGYMITPKELGVGGDGDIMMAEEAAMSTGGVWYLGMFEANAPDIEMKYLTIPHKTGVDSSGTLHAACYAMPKGGSQPKETMMAINYMMNDAHDEALIDCGYIPVNEKYYDTFRERQPELAYLVDAVPKSSGFGYPIAGKKFADGMISKMEEALFNADSTMTGAQMVKELQEEFGE